MIRRGGGPRRGEAGTATELVPILVRGRGRSGTTLLMQLLATAPGVVCETSYPLESRYLSYLVQLSGVIGLPRTDDDWTSADLMVRPRGVAGPLPFPVSVVDRDVLARLSLLHLWRAFSEAAVLGAGRPVTHYAEKFQFPLDPVIDAGLPVRQLRLVRDPRDLYVSVCRFNEKRGVLSFGRQEGQSDAEFLDWFLGWIRHDEDEVDRDVVRGVATLVVRYEDLVDTRGAAADRLGEWLGLRFDPEAVVAALPNLAHHMTSESAARSVSRWRTELSTEVAGRFADELAEVLDRYGYDR